MREAFIVRAKGFIMDYLVKASLTKQDAKSFKGACLTPQSFAFATFQDGDIVNGDEYYVNKAVKAGAKAGEVIKAKKIKKETEK